MAVALVLARVTWGMMDESATHRPLTPRTRHCWSVTAISSPSGPMRQVPETWRELPRVWRIQLSSSPSLARISSVGAMRPSEMPWYASDSRMLHASFTASRIRRISFSLCR